ncbi:M23 family metallopeptidase [Candidatus Methylomirabilis sp.]|uniref:M23 family metallopeptidase n=1 Tax=Candidatus Methylomirabilis tolerans TaxID=3123416 RepID=A0AAJ1AGD1_9BACT|nr:M23 family metallopeptidase [Candidatus Methylomirabilis sp.]
MARKFYTVLILPDASSQIRRFHIAKPLFSAISVTAGLIFVAFLFLIYQAVGHTGHMLELRQLRATANGQTDLLQKFERLENQMTQLREFDLRLRTAAGLEVKDAERAIVGVGGADTLSSRALMVAAVAHQGVAGDSSETIRPDNLGGELDRLSREMNDRNKSFQGLIGSLEAKRSLLASTPTIWPVKGWLTAGFGQRRSPFTGQRQMHEGVDIANTVGTPVIAPADGIVRYTGPLGGFGDVVSVDHGHKISTFYAHLQQHKVSQGQRVRRGDVLGLVGTTGRVTGPHLHYEIQVNEVSVDPTKYVIDQETVKYLGNGDSAE